MTGHTKGELQVTVGADLMLFLQPQEGNDILAHFGGDNDFADAHRMVACWNALVGVEDPEAFMWCVKELAGLNEGDSHSQWVRLRSRVREHLKGGE